MAAQNKLNVSNQNNGALATNEEKNDWQELAIKYLDTLGILKDLPREYKVQFVEIAKAYHLNPFRREIHAVPYRDANGRLSISVIVGYEVYLKRAERSGKLAGWSCVVEGVPEIETYKIKDKDGKEHIAYRVPQTCNCKAVLTIYRKDWSHPFGYEVYLRECFRDTKIWRERTLMMLKKATISTGFRLCFPCELGGLPYTLEEQWEPQVLDTAVEIVSQDVSKLNSQELDIQKPEDIKQEPQDKQENPQDKPKEITQDNEPVKLQDKIKENATREFIVTIKKALDKVGILLTDEQIEVLADKIASAYYVQKGLSLKKLTPEQVIKVKDLFIDRLRTPEGQRNFEKFIKENVKGYKTLDSKICPEPTLIEM